MFGRLGRYISREIRGLHKAAYLLGFFTFLSQVLGLFRDRLLAGTFGASTTLDIYYAAFKIPDLLLVLGASVVSISILVPLLSDVIAKDRERAKRLIDEVFSFFSLFIIVVASIVFIFTPFFTKLFFPGIAGAENHEILINLTRILLLSPIILGVSNVFASIVQVHHRFLVYALAPILYNVGIIFGILFFYPVFGINGLGYGVVLGALMHTGIQVPAVLQERFLPRIRKFSWLKIKTIVFISLPRALTMSVTQIILVVLLGLASLMENGAITMFNFSYNVQSVPLGIVGVSYSLAAFPVLSQMYSEKKLEAFTQRIFDVTEYMLLLALPLTALFIVLRVPIVSVLFRIGAFDVESTLITSAALAIFALSVPAQSLQLLLIRAYYAAGKTLKPLIMVLIGGGVTVCSAFALSHFFSHGSFLHILFTGAFSVDSPVLILPVAYTLGMITSTLLLWIWFMKEFGTHVSTEGLEKSFVEILLSSVIVGLVALILYNQFNGVFVARAYSTLVYGLVAGVVGICVGTLSLLLFKNSALKSVFSNFSRN